MRENVTDCTFDDERCTYYFSTDGVEWSEWKPSNPEMYYNRLETIKTR
jgi:hypothetical protein